MSAIATEARPGTVPSDLVPLSKIQRVFGRGPGATKSIIIAAGIRSFTFPGARTLFSLSDAQKVARGSNVAVGA